MLEAYSPKIIRITLSSNKADALGAAEYGIVGKPSSTGWTHVQDSQGYDVIRSGRMVIRIAPQNLPSSHGMPLDALNRSLREPYFGGGAPARGPLRFKRRARVANGAIGKDLTSERHAPSCLFPLPLRI